MIEVLYHGDIDDAPDGTELAVWANGAKFVKNFGNGIDRSVKLNGGDIAGANTFGRLNYVYLLVRAFCLQAKEIDGQVARPLLSPDGREIRIRKNDICPWCDLPVRNWKAPGLGDCGAEHLQYGISLAPAIESAEKWEATEVTDFLVVRSGIGVTPYCRTCDSQHCVHAKSLRNPKPGHYIVSAKDKKVQS